MDKARLEPIAQATVVLILMSLGSVLMKVALADVVSLSFAWLTIGIGLTVTNHILRTLRSYEASILGASTLIWTTILTVIILGESLTWYQITGMSLMIVGLLLVQVRRGKLDTFFQQFKQALFPHRDDGASKIPSLPAQR
jgi:drug/metabolite transporter (DMT)-like permease